MSDGWKITVKGAADALMAARGNLSMAARKLGVSRSGLDKFVQAHPELQDVRVEAKEAMLDVAEDQLFSLIHTGDIRAITLYLKTQGKDRGYTERQEITGRDGGALVARQEAATLKDLSPDELAKLTQELLALGKV